MFGQGFHFKTPISPRKATYLQSEQILLKQGRTRCQWCIYCSGWNNNSSEAAVKAQQWSLKPRMKPLGHLILLGVSDPIWSLKELPVWSLSMISHFEVVLHASVVGIGEGPCLEEGLYQWTHFCFIQTVNFQWQMPDSWPQVKDTQQWFTVFNKGTDTTEGCQGFLHHLQFCYKRKEFLLNEWDLLFQRLACSGIKMEVCSQSRALSHVLLLRCSCIKNNPV